LLDFSEEHKLAAQLIRTWCTTRLGPATMDIEEGKTPPYALMRELCATFGIADTVREALRKGAAEDGAARPDDAPGRFDAGSGRAESGPRGSSEGPLMAILMMELSRVCPGFAMSFGASLGLCGGAILARGTAEQRARFAVPVMTMEKIGAWALTEPGAGSDAFGSMSTRAHRVDGGWRLSGSKTFITNAPYADVFVVYARVAGANAGTKSGVHPGGTGAGAHGTKSGVYPGGTGAGSETGVRAFVLERGAAGLATGLPMKKMGMHASPTGEIFLDDVFVPGDQLLGGEAADDERVAAKSSLKGERFGMTPMCLGIVDRCLEESVRYAKERVQWGQPIATFQLVQEKLAHMYMARAIIHALLMRQLEAERAGVVLLVEEACAGKLYCARAATDVAMEAIQLKGGAGYMRDGIVEMLARDAKLLQIGGGTDEIQILRIAREVLSRPV
jgi:alkylation response protein AidB-like acyl-CoA dehydrogenase